MLELRSPLRGLSGPITRYGVSAPTGPWNPSFLGADLALWLDADDADTLTIVASGGDIVDATLTSTYTKPANVDGSYDLFFKPDGTKVYVCEDTATGNVIELTLSTPWDITTASFSSSIVAGDDDIRACFISPDGTLLFVSSENTTLVARFSLSTPWDLSTAVLDNRTSLPSPANDYTGIFFKEDGTRVFVTERFSGRVYYFSLSTPWDIATATQLGSYELFVSSSSYYGLYFSADGSTMYTGNISFDRIEVYGLATPWDVTTASLETSFSTASFTGSPIGVFIKPDSSKLYISDISRIFELDIPVSSTVSQWDDKSGNGRHAIQATASNQPAYTATGLNGRPVVTFDGAGDGFTLASGLGVPRDIYIINRGSGYLFSANTATERLMYTTNTSSVFWSTGSPLSNTLVPNRDHTTYQIEGYSTNDTEYNLLIDGTSELSGSISSWTNNNVFNQIGLQWDAPTGITTWSGEITEIVWTNTNLSPNDRQKLEGYLAHKWGLTANLPVAHPYKTTPPIVGGAPAPLAADYGTGAAAAYSLRYVSNNYSGPVIRVREDSGNTEQDFTPVQITNGTLEAFVGAGNNGFVTTWYDQSGNGKNAFQATAGSQPAIVSSGSLIVENGKPAILFDGGNDSLETSGYIVGLSQNNVTLFATGRFEGPYDLVEADNLLSYSSNFILSGTTSGSVILWVNTAEFGTRDRLVQSSMGFIYDGVNFQAYTNGALSGVSGPATINPEVGDKTVIGARADFSAGFSSSAFQELIIYHSDESVNRLAIDFDINTHYGIY